MKLPAPIKQSRLSTAWYLYGYMHGLTVQARRDRDTESARHHAGLCRYWLRQVRMYTA